MVYLLTFSTPDDIQNKAILLVHEYEKQGKIKDEYRRVFDAVKKAKPGIDVIND